MERFFSKEYLREDGVNGLLMCMKREMLGNIPLFSRKVFEAWGHFLLSMIMNATYWKMY